MEAEATTVNVSDWKGFVLALSDVAVTQINITGDFAVPTNPRAGVETITRTDLFNSNNTSGGLYYLWFTKSNISRNVVIEGNGHEIDFKALAFSFDPQTFNASNPWNITWKNLQTYHGNYYGIMSYTSLLAGQEAQSKVVYDNVADIGNQLIHSPRGIVEIKGTSSNLQQANYTSKFGYWGINATNQANMYISDLTVKDGASFTVSTINAGNIELGKVATGSLKLERNSRLIAKANGTGKAAEEAQGANLLVWSGDVTLDEGAQLDLTTQNNSSGVSLAEQNSNLTIGRGASLRINSNGHTTSGNALTTNLIYLAGGSKLNVAEGGELYVNATGMGSSSTNILNVASKATVIVNKNGVFDIKSDSSSPNQSLMYFGSSDSMFNFADARIVNLQRTTNFGIGSTNGLINMAGTGGALEVNVQKVSRWASGNYTETPTGSWLPMYLMSLRYSGYTPTVAYAYSTSDSNVADFKANFTTRNTQRILFEYIPDIKTEILNTLTDEVGSINAMKVYGMTSPYAYVRLSDVPANATVAPAFPKNENTVKSPVALEDAWLFPDISDNFTVRADAMGMFNYQLTSNKRFSAGTVIQAYSFLNGKSSSVKQTVLDKTPPKGAPKEYHIGKGKAVPDPKVFVMNPTDTNPVAQNYTYQYSSENPIATIQGMLDVVGEHVVKIDLFDNAKNKTTITSKLIVHHTENAINAIDISIDSATLVGMTDTQIKEYILAHSSPEASKIVDGVYADMSSKVQVSNLGSLMANSIIGTYKVTLTVKKEDSGLLADMNKDIVVTVIKSASILTVNFVNEANQTLSGYTVKIDGFVGDTIDLTKQVDVLAQLSNVTSAGYEIKERPNNEHAISLNQTAVIVQYKIQGVLSLASVPTTLGFGSLSYEATNKRVENPKVDKKLIVTDTRVNASTGFNITATLTVPMTNANGKKLANALRYVYRGSEKILNTQAQEVYINNKGVAGSYPVSDSWGDTKGTDGVKLQMNSSDVVYKGDYTGVITWKVMAGQP